MCSLMCETLVQRAGSEASTPRELLKYEGPGSSTGDPQGAEDGAQLVSCFFLADARPWVQTPMLHMQVLL